MDNHYCADATCRERCSSVGDQLRQFREKKRERLLLDTLDYEVQLLRKLIQTTEDYNRIDAYTSLVAQVNEKRLIMHHDLDRKKNELY